MFFTKILYSHYVIAFRRTNMKCVWVTVAQCVVIWCLMQLLVQPFLIKLIFIFILFNKYFFCFVRQLQRSIHTEYGSVNNFINRCLSSHVLAQKMHSVLQGKGVYRNRQQHYWNCREVMQMRFFEGNIKSITVVSSFIYFYFYFYDYFGARRKIHM